MRSQWTLLLISALMAGTCLAQSEKNKDEQEKFYRLDFVVKEVADARVINTRSYSTMISTGHSGDQIRVGNKVPVQTGNPSPNAYDYIDVGVNIDCRSAREVEGHVALNVAAEVSNLAPGQTVANGSLPLLRQNKWSSEVILPLRKPTVIFSSDDPTSTHKMQVELTATPIR
jgi:Bacterial type II and III secretion system protein